MRLVLFLLLAAPILAAAQDPRFCGQPERYADGTIKRSSAVLRDFVDIHPCPSTGAKDTVCPGWNIDHEIPLAACGCDSIGNLKWEPVVLKAGPGTLPKDRWERRIYKCPGEAIELTPMPHDPPPGKRFRLQVIIEDKP